MKKTFASVCIIMMALSTYAFCMSRSDMETDIRSLIGETSTTFITDTELDRWINQGQYEVALFITDDMLWELQTSSTQAVSVGDTTYTIPTDMVRLISAHLASYEMTIISPAEALALRKSTSWSTDTTKPFMWMQANQLNIYPTPTATDTLTVYYIKRPTEMSTDATVCSLNLMLHHLVVYYAASKAALKVRAFDMAAEFRKLFYDTIQLYNTKMIRKNRLEGEQDNAPDDANTK